jgi:hypothetical protein
MNIYKEPIKKYANKVGLFCNARDEINIKEWAAHHLMIGFDIIIIFDHKSKESLKEIFENFDKRVNIIRIDLETTEVASNNIKLMLMNQAREIAKKWNMDWFIYLDADEFLILNRFFKDVKHFLNAYSYADSIGVNWLMFGSNNFVNDPSGLLLENYTSSDDKLDQHVKSFVRPSKIKFCENPHYYVMINPLRMLGIDFKIMKNPYCFNNIDIPFYKVSAYIAHYVYQSETTYKRRKIDLMGDDGTTRSSIGKDIHQFYNNIINIQPQKYVKNIKKFLQHYS